MKKSIWLFCLLSFKLVYSQKVEILNKSGFEHNYVVKKLEYIEDVNDTSKLNYIATLRIAGKTYNYAGIYVKWAMDFQTESKKLGANAFCLKEYIEKDSIGTLIVNIYFAGDNFLKRNQLKCDKKNVYLFGERFDIKDSTNFYLNGSKQVFNSTKNYLINTSLNTDYNIAVTKNKLTNTLIRYKSEKQSRYFIIPQNKADMVSFKPARNPVKKGNAGFATALAFGGLIGGGIYMIVSTGPNKVIEIPYKYGRLMSEIYK